MGSVEVLRDHHNLLEDPPYLQRARMADQLYHSLDRLRMQRTGLLQNESGRASPVQIKKKLRRLSEGQYKGGSPSRETKENDSMLSYGSSRASSVSSTLSRPILKRKYTTNTLTRPKHVHFLSDVTVFEVDQDGTHVCTSSEQLNTEPSSRIYHKINPFTGGRLSDLTSQDNVDSSRGIPRPGTPAVVTHAVLDKPGMGKVGIGAVITHGNQQASPLPKPRQYSVTVSTNVPSQTVNKNDNSINPMNNDSKVYPQTKTSSMDNHSSRSIPSNINPSKSNPNNVRIIKANPNNNLSSTGKSISINNNNTKSNPNSGSLNKSVPSSAINSVPTSDTNSYNSSANGRNLNITFTQDPKQGTKLKFVVGIGLGYDPEDIVVKANMNGSRIRVMATKVLTRPDGTNEVQQFNERFVLPMDIDPFSVDARLDTKGLLTVEAPLVTLERRQSQSDSNQSVDTL